VLTLVFKDVDIMQRLGEALGFDPSTLALDKDGVSGTLHLPDYTVGKPETENAYLTFNDSMVEGLTVKGVLDQSNAYEVIAYDPPASTP
jgi:hypothetical protein